MHESLKSLLALLALPLLTAPTSFAETGDEAEAPPPCDDVGMLSGSIFGAIEGELDWTDAKTLSCDGMPRPAGEGARLRFAGPHPSGDGTLAVIIALPALGKGSDGQELDSRITVIEEGGGRFFSTREQSRCWTDLAIVEARSEEQFVVNGTLYCIGPVGEVNGDDAVVLGDLTFTGLIDWAKS